MRHRTLPMLLVCGSLLAALPAAAEVYTIRLTNGTIFESRYQPKQAAWDAGMLTFLDETGLDVALPKALIADVMPQSELKGFGKVINTTTVDLGYAPNDLDLNQANMQAEANVSPFEAAMNRSYDQEQFVEPDQVGGGIPVGFSGGGGSGFTGGPFVPPSVTLPPTSTPGPTAPAAPTTPTTPTTTPQQ